MVRLGANPLRDPARNSASLGPRPRTVCLASRRATQVLETLAKTGQPSRAEITDAAMGERAECVMLNKGAHIMEAIHALDGILSRREAHQHKKRSMLRKLHW